MRRHGTGLILLLTALVSGASGAWAQEKPAPKVRCVAEQVSSDVVDAKSGKTKPFVNWTARCEIREGDSVIYAAPLVLPYPATKRDAYDAMDEFMDVKAPEILKKRKEKKP